MRGIKIVVFGSDNSGKTTLCKNLSESLDYRIVPPLGPANINEQIIRMDWVLEEQEGLILDRWPIIEEEVCGRVLRNKSNFDDIPREEWDMYYKGIDLFIHCEAPVKKVMNWGEREQMKGIKENILELRQGYNDIALSLLETPYKLFYYDWTTDRTGYQFRTLINLITDLKERKK